MNILEAGGKLHVLRIGHYNTDGTANSEWWLVDCEWNKRLPEASRNLIQYIN